MKNQQNRIELVTRPDLDQAEAVGRPLVLAEGPTAEVTLVGVGLVPCPGHRNSTSAIR